MLKIIAAMALGVCSQSAFAQFTITDVVNAGSRLPSGRQSSGIAQGAVFLTLGRGVGPADFQQATFPLPTTDGLAGVNVQVIAADQIYDAPMVYVAANEVAAILPSSVPVGAATVKVTNNGVSASRAIRVVAAAFGIFTVATNSVEAAAFNVTGDGSFQANGITQTAAPGQDMLINGTGLGAISSDETQSGVTDVPASTVQVYVGVTPATVVSAGRGACCDGLDPNFRIPQGVAGWDVIRFTVPDGVAGCQIPVLVQTGSFISNVSTISIDASGTDCKPLRGILPQEFVDPLKDKKGLSGAFVGISRSTGITTNGAGVFSIRRTDNAATSLIHYNTIPADAFVAAYGAVLPNSCFIPPLATPAFALPLPTNLDAGASLTINGPAGTRTIPRLTIGNLTAYDPTVTLGNATPGNYLDPGHYTLTAPGGKDVSQFNTSIDLPSPPFTWTNQPTTPGLTIDRSEGYTIKWTGGTPGTLVTIVGGSTPVTTNFTLATSFRCDVAVEAGEFTIPPFALLNLAPTGTSNGLTYNGTLNLANTKIAPFKAPGLDIGILTNAATYTVTQVTYK